MTKLIIPRYFTIDGIHPYDAVAWEVRDAVIMGKDDTPVFEARGVEFPAQWSQRATDIVTSKYFRVVNGRRETSVKQMLLRVADTIAEWGRKDGYFAQSEIFYQELTHILLNQYACFNSPVWFNVGVQERPQTSACFTVDIQDSMESILDWYRQEGMIFKGGSGCGVNLSKIRAKGAPLSNGGKASGPLSFMRVADANAGAVKSGGSSRRAACMRILNVDHPDIEAFIQCKVDAEKLARHLMQLGYGNGIEDGAYDQVPWQNANNSVNMSNAFMEDVACLVGLASPKAHYRQELFYKIAQAAWECGDPALFFGDTINAWNTSPNSGPIVSSNPCGEFLRPPDEACNLASLNLLKFLGDDGSFDIPAFTHTVDIMITAMDIMIDHSSYPTEAIAQNSRNYRPLGLGYCNLGALLMAKGLPYDSDEGRALAVSITALMTGEAYSQSARLSLVQAAFNGFASNEDAMRGVIEKHRVSLYDNEGFTNDCESGDLFSCASAVLNKAKDLGGIYGYRNCQVTVLAPCGTISFMMDADTTGIEPCLGLVTIKKLVGGGELKIVNRIVEHALRSYWMTKFPGDSAAVREDSIVQALQYLNVHGEFEGFLEYHEALPIFDCALPVSQRKVDTFGTESGGRCISWQGHIKMVAAVQPFISGGISKTINMPHNTTVEDVRDAYIMAWKMGLKAIAIYRDGSKGVQPVTVVGKQPGAIEQGWAENYADQYRFIECSACTPCRVQTDDVQSGISSLCESCRNNRAIIDDFKHLWIDSVRNPTMQDAGNHSAESGVGAGLQRRRLPDERHSITHKFTINTHEGYLTVGLYDDGSPGEIFVRMSKEGSTLGGLMDAWGTVMSIALQYGVPLSLIVAKFKDGQYEPRGFTSNPEIRTTTSITDYIMRWMELKFGGASFPVALAAGGQGVKPVSNRENGDIHDHMVHSAEKVREVARRSLAALDTMVQAGRLTHDKHVERIINFESNGTHSSAPFCSECGNMTLRNGSCYVCTVCGTTTGCS